MKQINNTYEYRTMNKNGQKAARKLSRLERIMSSSATYMANYAVIRGNLPSFNSSALHL